MSERQTNDLARGDGRWIAAVAAALLVASVLCAGGVVRRADRQMRDELLIQTRLAAHSVDRGLVRALSGTGADAEKAEYLRLKEQLSDIRQANSKSRFLYLLGREDAPSAPDAADKRSARKIFFLVDSEPSDSPDYSPPGQVFEDISQDARRMFDTQQELVEGPVTDRWGTWVSALIPIRDPATLELVAVFGMDIDARTWKWDVFARAVLPASLMLAVLILFASGVIATRVRAPGSAKPLQRRLMIPLASGLLLLIAGFGALLLRQQRDYMDQYGQKEMAEVADHLATLAAEQARGLAALGQLLIRDAGLLKALKARDRERLQADYGPLFVKFRDDHHLTHFYFIGTDRVCLLRAHQPEKHGDRIDRFTLREAERTGKTASGLELGPLGTLTLRSVRPVYEGATLIGYLELDKEIEEILPLLHGEDGVEIALTLHKSGLERAGWEGGLRMLGRKADWGRFPADVLVYSSLASLPEKAERFIGKTDGTADGGFAEMTVGSQVWRAVATPLKDASGTEVGELHVLRDITAAKAAQRQVQALGVGGALVLMSGLFGILFVLLRRTDQGIQMQQAELRASEERHRAMFEKNRSIQMLLDPRDGTIIDANSTACAYYGYPLAQFRKMKVTAINTLPPEEVLRKMEEARSERSTRFVFKHRLADGQIRDVEVHSGPIPVNGREVLYSIVYDITESSRAEEALNKERRLVSALMDNVPDHIYFKDADSRFILISKTHAAKFGLSDASQALGKSDFDFFTAEHAQVAFEDEQAIIRTGQPVMNQEEKETWADGHTTWVTTTKMPLLGDNGKIIGTFGISHDITARKRREEALRASESRMNAITQSAQDAILMMDPQGRIAFWNPAAERIFGYTSAEVVGLNLHRLIAPQRYHEAHRSAFAEFCATGQGRALNTPIELQACRKGGDEISVELSLSAIQLEDGWHAVGLMRDITARKRAEEELRETNRQLEAATSLANGMAAQAARASAAKSDFLANMSHEIRTPMNGVIGMTGLLLDSELTDEQRRYAETVRASGEALLSLVNDILDFSKIEAGKLDLEILEFDLANLLEDFMANIALRAQDKGLELLCGIAADVPTRLCGDPGRLRQILTNLVGNAIKFTETGEVAVRVTLEQEEEAGVGTPGSGSDTADARLRFSVRDTGIGIPKETLGLLFEKFTQADASTTRKYGGTGLGLAISKQLTELMGGKVSAASEVGRGSEFSFTVRLVRPSGCAKAEALPPADLRNVRVLIVDDNATSREILSTRMVSWGMRPCETPDGPAALVALLRARDEADPFKIAVVDMQMPGMDGEALGLAIRADKRLDDTRLVMLTSLGTRGDARHIAEIGFEACLTKPARNQELKSVLCLALGDRGSAQSQPALRSEARPASRDLTGRFAASKARILLAEDNITNQQVALGILKKLGLRADAVANGAEAVKAVEALPYDVILMDVQMPVMDGLEATRLIRRRQGTDRSQAVPIIAMTAHAMQGDREKCLAAGMNDYISKPVMPQALAETLDKWLPQEPVVSGRRGGCAGQELPQDVPAAELLVWDREGMMERMMGDEELAKTILAGFLDDIAQRIQTLKALLVACDAAGVERQAHVINGAISIVGGIALHAVVYGMEKAVRGGRLADAGALMSELEAQFARLRAVMEGDRLTGGCACAY
jgi:PAS domain S-box-containing protein